MKLLQQIVLGGSVVSAVFTLFYIMSAHNTADVKLVNYLNTDMMGLENNTNLNPCSDRVTQDNGFDILLQMEKTLSNTVSRIFYNRIPKCGSTTVSKIFKSLSKENNFTHHLSPLWNKIHLNNETEEKEFVETFQQYTLPLLYDRHFHFVNFTSLGSVLPVYINIMREPLERLISHWHFNRQPGNPNYKGKIKETFDQCMKRNCSDILRLHGGQWIVDDGTLYICGHQPLCRKAGSSTLAATKNIIKKYYTVIGITEDMKGFFENLEFVHPRYFNGAVNKYNAIVAAKKGVSNKGRNKKKIKQSTRDRLTYLMKYEYELYYFVRQRHNELLTQVRNIKKGKTA